MYRKEKPMEIIDTFRWDERSKLITRDIHQVSGLMNFTYLKTLASEPATPIHFHSNIIEIHCIVKGCRHSRLYVDDQMAKYTYTGGEIFVVFPGEYHSTGSESQQAPCEVLAIQLNMTEASNFLGLDSEKGADLCRRLSSLSRRHLRTNPDDLALLKRAFHLFATRDSQDQDEGLVHLVCFLYRMLRMPPTQLSLPTASNRGIQKAINHIHENIHDHLNLEELANLSGYSLSRFKTKFRSETGQTPAFYISTAKVEEAKRALLESDQSITDIAYNLGWSSSNYFCTVFRKLTGISPLQYRKNNR